MQNARLMTISNPNCGFIYLAFKSIPFNFKNCCSEILGKHFFFVKDQRVSLAETTIVN